MTVFDPTVRDGVCRLARPGTRWLPTAPGGDRRVADAAYNVTVPDDWRATDLAAAARERRERAGFDDDGPTLFTAVPQDRARRARLDGVEAVVTAGLSNPTVLPVGDADVPADRSGASGDPTAPGTINVVVGTDRALAPGALADLVAAAAEAKAATLSTRAGVVGTTTDAVVAACDPGGDPERFAGAATPVGRAARVCVRDALLASLDAGDESPSAPDDATGGTVIGARADVSRL